MTKEGYILDYISGDEVKASPEEVEAVQVFAKQLVEDYGYPKEHIQTRPQFRVKVRPSDTKKEYPVDIALFNNTLKTDDNLYILVECKGKTRNDGEGRLQNYLKLSKADIGVWFNGKERLFIRKIEHAGKVYFAKIPNIPRYGERLEDIGKFKRKDLKIPHNLKVIFKTIRNYLAGNAVGATRDEELAKQLINVIFCKIHDEDSTKLDELVTFRAGTNESAKDVSNRIKGIFENVKDKYKEVLDFSDKIELDDKSIMYIVGELQNYSLMESERDVVADAFEVFIGHALKGGQGQFFTPRNVVKMMVEIMQLSPDDLIIDPACGSGGFLVESLKYVWKKLEMESNEYAWKPTELQNKKIDIATKNIRGIEKDELLSKVTKAYMVIIGDGKGGIFCDDSLKRPSDWENSTRQGIKLGTFDAILTNPPFGAKIRIEGEEKLKQYNLGHKWKKNKDSQKWEQAKLKDKEAPQILFIERCFDLLKDGGRMALVLPEGTFGNPSDRYIWEFLLENATIEAVISLPTETFQPHTHFKTSILVIKKGNPLQDYNFFMGIANTCGHNKNGKDVYKKDASGNNILDDEVPLIAEEYKKFKDKQLQKRSHLGFSIKLSDIKNHVFIPNYYDPDLQKDIQDLSNSKQLISIAELKKQKIITVNRGNEVDSANYGKGDIPFIRTSDIVNLELKFNPVKCIPEEVYLEYKDRQNIKQGDILFVKDGTFLIGRTAYITELDTKIVIQSHINKISVQKNDLIDSYYLLYLFNLPIVQKQVQKYTFIQGTLSTVGDRFNEIILPIHKNPDEVKDISNKIKDIIDKKKQIRDSINEIVML